MKKLLFILLIVILVMPTIIQFASAETEEVIIPHIIYTKYANNQLYGIVDLPDYGQYYIMCTVFVGDNMYAILFIPIDNYGCFTVYFEGNINHLTIQVVEHSVIELFNKGYSYNIEENAIVIL